MPTLYLRTLKSPPLHHIPLLSPLAPVPNQGFRSKFDPPNRYSSIARAMEPQTLPDPPTSAVPASSQNAILSRTPDTEPLVMQIVVRRDLFDKEKWGVGPLMAQAAHAATAVLHETRERQETIDYLADLRNMRKVVLQTPDVSTLEKLSAALSNADPSPVPHHVWTEQPENIPTCVALAPNRKEKSIRKALDKSSCRLWRSD